MPDVLTHVDKELTNKETEIPWAGVSTTAPWGEVGTLLSQERMSWRKMLLHKVPFI